MDGFFIIEYLATETLRHGEKLIKNLKIILDADKIRKSGCKPVFKNDLISS
jgi:hypothetical protein